MLEQSIFLYCILYVVSHLPQLGLNMCIIPSDADVNKVNQDAVWKSCICWCFLISFCSLWSAEVQESHLQWGAEIKQHCVHCCVFFFCSLVSVIGQCHTCGYLWFCKYNSCKLLDRLYITFVQSDLSTGRHSDADLVDCGRDKAQCWSLQRGCILDIYFNLPYQHTNPGQFCAIRHFFKFWVQ